tara:strand:- start:116 stop:523 length:408 start_codon:yes stop_codon:yes gene_type:complete
MDAITWMKHILSIILGIFFINVGIGHFVEPEWFEPIVPAILGDPTFWVLLTGAMEIILGVGIIIPQSRKYSGLLMTFFLIAIYWANLNMWINNVPLDGKTFATIWHIIRLLLQILMILVALWVGGWMQRKENNQT